MTKKSHKKQRVDLLLVERGLANSAKEAQALIYTGKVFTRHRKIDKPSETIEKNGFLGVKDVPSRFVSRGGEKLFGALQSLNLFDSIQGIQALDVGSSTGGFTDCLLQCGADHVVSLDVGSNQLAWKLQKNPNVTSLEKTHIKDIKEDDKKPFDLIVADISFNSLENLAPYILKASTKDEFFLLLLVKPQFELPKDMIPKGGVVTSTEHQEEAIKNVISCLEGFGLTYIDQAPSPIKGRTGNAEFFVYFKKTNTK